MTHKKGMGRGVNQTVRIKVGIHFLKVQSQSQSQNCKCTLVCFSLLFALFSQQVSALCICLFISCFKWEQCAPCVCTFCMHACPLTNLSFGLLSYYTDTFKSKHHHCHWLVIFFVQFSSSSWRPQTTMTTMCPFELCYLILLSTGQFKFQAWVCRCTLVLNKCQPSFKNYYFWYKLAIFAYNSTFFSMSCCF